MAKPFISHRLLGLSATTLLLFLGAMVPASACPIPVFQFSLEYWPTDPYQIEIRHDGNFTDEQQKALELLEQAVNGEATPSNIVLSRRDYSQADIAPPEGATLPYLKVRYPEVSGIRKVLWNGPLEVDAVKNLLDSPIRREISDRLLEREASVWVLLKSGNSRADRRVLELLQSELPRMEETLKVPDPGEEGIDLGDIQTDIRFSMVSLDRDDPEEQMFIRMLLGIERDLEEFEDQPIVFPIYGRGLIMYAIIGDGINPWTLNAAGEFLTGPCSCQIKAGNPGVDLLTTADWEGRVEKQTTFEAERSGPDAGSFLQRMEEAEERLRD